MTHDVESGLIRRLVQTLFIFICCFTAGFYMLSLFAERWLRHVDRLPVDLRVREKIFGQLLSESLLRCPMADSRL